MKTTRLTVSQKQAPKLDSDLVVYFLPQDKNSFKTCDPFIRKTAKQAFKLGDFKGKPGEILMRYVFDFTKNTDVKAKRLVLAGLGRIKDEDKPESICEAVREAAGTIAGICKKIKVKTLVISLPKLKKLDPQITAQCLIEGILLGDYHFLKYKKKKTGEKKQYTGINTIRICPGTEINAVRKGVQKGMQAAFAACEARDMANEPGNGWTSKEFADYAKKLSEDLGLKYTCLEKKQLEKLGMGGLLAVNQGSEIPPKMVILEYEPDVKDYETILLVGKGITFDSGGISLKPGAGMEEMKYDMCGGAAVLAAMQAVASEKPPVKVVSIIPATDNLPGGSAVRPGDIIRHFNGVTSEIVNTDAEGRMILGDALSYGVKTFSPDCVMDIATLTGAVIVGLGHHYSGLISNNDELSKRLILAGEKAGEPVWRLPLNKDYKKQIESKVADIKNIGGKPAGTITAAAYLSNFVGKTPWAHLDIAGTAWNFTKKSYIPEGPSGICVRTFIYLIREWKNGGLKA